MVAATWGSHYFTYFELKKPLATIIVIILIVTTIVIVIIIIVSLGQRLTRYDQS